MRTTGDVIVEFIAAQAGGASRLLALHVPDTAGRCRCCTLPGTGISHAPWPCPIHFYAAAADEVERHRDSFRGRST